jgi:hypothetical protein
MSGETGGRLANGRSGLRRVHRLASLWRRIRFSDVAEFGTPRQKVRGFFGTLGY